MAEGAFFIMAVILLLLVLAVGGVLAVVAVAAILVAKPATRSIGLRIVLVGGVGIVLTDIIVFIARTNPSVEHQLPLVIRILLIPLIWGRMVPHPIFAYTATSLSGFACAGGIATLVAVAVLIRRSMKRTPNQASEVTARKLAEPQG